MSHFPTTDCAACPLFNPRSRPTRAVVGSSRLLVVGDFPTWTEAQAGTYRSGLAKAGLDILERLTGEQPTALYAVACGGYFGLSPEDRARAVRCCAPRLPAAQPGQVIVTQGLEPTQHYLPGARKLEPVLGAPVVGPAGAVIVPTLPQRDLDKSKKPAYRAVQTAWFKKAAKMLVQGRLDWSWPEIVTTFDGDEAVIGAIRRLHEAPLLGLDVETPRLKRDDYVRWPDIRLLDVGVGSPDLKLAVDVSWEVSSLRVREEMQALLDSQRARVLALHNGTFDLRVFGYRGIEIRGQFVDTMHAFRLCYPGVKEGLDTVAAFLTDAPRWKDEFREVKGGRDFDGSGGGSDDEDEDEDEADGGASSDDTPLPYTFPTIPSFDQARAVYCAKDAYLQAFLWPQLEAKLATVTDGPRRFAERMTAVQIARRMTAVGVRVEPRARRVHSVRLGREVDRWADEVRAAAPGVWVTVKKLKKGDVVTPRPMNPASLRDVNTAFDRLGVAPLAFTDTGQPRWDEQVLQGLAGSPREGVAPLARALLKYRETSKALGTYVKKLPVFEDGYLHVEHKAQHANTTRWGSANTNLQNFPKWLRNMLRARPGMRVVEADFNAQELRWIAQVAGVRGMLDVFQSGGDLHNENTAFIFGMAMADVKRKKKAGAFLERDIAKMVQLSMNYCASAETIHGQIVVKPKFRDMKLSFVAHVREKLLERYPEIPAWWRWTQQQAETVGVIRVPFSNHELFTYGFYDPALMTNFQIQGAGGWQMNLALRRIARYIGWIDDAAPTIQTPLFIDPDAPAILANQHDASWTQWPAHRVQEGIRVVRELSEMTIELNGSKLHYPVEAKYGIGFGGRAMKG